MYSFCFSDISYNPIAAWEGDIDSSDFPSVTAVDVTNNSKWIADKLTKITSLKHIYGVSWNQHCINCNLTRHNEPVFEKDTSKCTQAAKYFFMRFLVSCDNLNECMNFFCEGDTTPDEFSNQAKNTSDVRRKYFMAGLALGIVIPPSIHPSSIHSFFHSFFHSFIQSFAHSLNHSFIHSLTRHSLSHLLTHSFIHFTTY